MARVSVHDIAMAIISLSKKRPKDSLAKDIASYIVAERRSNDLGAIMREVDRLRQQKSYITEVTLTTAVEPTDLVIAEARRLLNRKVVINKVIDRNVIGGVRIESSDYYLDLTVRNRLNKLKIGA